MKSDSSVPVASSRASWDADPFREDHARGWIVPELRGDALQADRESVPDPSFPRESRRSDDSVWDYSALLMQERRKHSAALADRDRLLAIFSHDLRNLLNALALNAAIVLRRNGGAAEEGASKVQRIVGRMDRMLSDLLDLARVNADKLHVVVQTGDTAEIVREALDAFRPLAEEKHLSLCLSEVTTCPFIARIDHDRIFQVLANLLSNAIKFSPPEGQILVGLSTINQFVRVAVRDFGPGIEGKDLERIFECYRQGEGLDATGLGLGLFISKSIVQAHGGQIWAESARGSGSTFFFTVPRIDPATAAAPPAPLPAVLL